jgi:hypothetical protein
MYACIYACMYLCMYVCMYVCMMYVCMFICVSVCRYACLSVCLFRSMDAFRWSDAGLSKTMCKFGVASCNIVGVCSIHVGCLMVLSWNVSFNISAHHIITTTTFMHHRSCNRCTPRQWCRHWAIRRSCRQCIAPPRTTQPPQAHAQPSSRSRRGTRRSTWGSMGDVNVWLESFVWCVCLSLCFEAISRIRSRCLSLFDFTMVEWSIALTVD